MLRIARLVIKGEPAMYHVISRTVLDGFVLGDVEKDYLFKLIKRLSSVYFSEVFGFCVMGNHFSHPFSFECMREKIIQMKRSGSTREQTGRWEMETSSRCWRE